MDRLFSPWRYSYVSAAPQDGECVLCSIGGADPVEDPRHFVVSRHSGHFVVLNIYPYNSGHLMIVPYAHAARLTELDAAARAEMFEIASRAERLLFDVYRAEGVNLGMNLGRCAGAGIAAHLHLHAVPRWGGDTSFMTVTGETRVLPEDLHDTWRKLRGRL